MKVGKIVVFSGFCLALILFGLAHADDGTELVYTRAKFNKTVDKGFVVAFLYTLNHADQEQIVLPDGTQGFTPQWHRINRVDELMGQLQSQERYDEVVTFVRVNLARGDLDVLRDTYALTGPAILLFARGRLIGKPVPVGDDFTISGLKRTNEWLTFDDFVQQRLADLDKAERAKEERQRKERRIYNYYAGPRPYLSLGWGGGYYGPGWGWGRGYYGPGYVGFGVTI